jgi:hypothetical protein
VLVRAELDNAVARELVGRKIAHHVRTPSAANRPSHRAILDRSGAPTSS